MYKIINSIKTIDQYNKKYKHHKDNLVVLTKREIDEFDLMHNCKGEKRLLKDKKWVLIGDTYHEVPRPIRWTWFRNLNAGIQTVTSVLLIGAIGSAIGVPTYIMLKGNNGGGVVTKKIDIDPKYSKDVTSNVTIDKNGNISGTLSLKDSANNDFTGVAIEIGSTKLNNDEYSFDVDTGELLVESNIVNKYSGDVVITPAFVNNPGSSVDDATAFDTIIENVCGLKNEINYKCTAKTITNSDYLNKSTDKRNYIINIDVDDEGQIVEEYFGEEYDDPVYRFGYGDGNVSYLSYDWSTQAYHWEDSNMGFKCSELYSVLEQAKSHFSDLTYDKGIYKGKFDCTISSADINTEFELKFNSDGELIKAKVHYSFDYGYTFSVTQYFRFDNYDEVEIEIPTTDRPIKKLVVSIANNGELDINSSEGLQLSATFKEQSVYDQLTVTSSPTGIVTVEDGGLVKPVASTDGGAVQIYFSGDGYQTTYTSLEVANYSNLDYALGEEGVEVSLKSGDTSSTIIIPSYKVITEGQPAQSISKLSKDKFTSSSSLTRVVIPSSIHKIDKGAFASTLTKAKMDPNYYSGWKTYYYDEQGQSHIRLSINSTDIENEEEFAKLINGTATKYSDYDFISNM